MQKFRKLPRLPSIPSRIRLRRLFTRKRIFIAAGLFAAFLLITPVVTYAYYARDINNRERLMNRNNTGVVLKDRKGEVFYEFGRLSGNDDVPLDQISDNVEHALIASEDKDFYKHEGYSVRGMARALYGNVMNREATRYGGSTITQQLVKNKLLNSNKNFLRKYQELSMAVAVERHYTKNEILSMYLNSVYFGEGAFGIGDAAQTYYGKSPADLTIAESAMLIGVLPAPTVYSPVSGDKELAAREQKRVLNQMVNRGYIKKDEKLAASKQELVYTRAETAQTFDHAQHYAQMVLDELHKKYGEERVRRSGFKITTSLDLNAQKEAEAIVKKRIAVYAAGGGENAGLVAIEPKTGFVRALVGSSDWTNKSFGQVNMALMPRQPGSSFKPIYYGEALDKHLITAATILHDKPTTFGNWTPQNYDFRFRGNITARNALAQSLNIPAAEVMQKVGPEEASTAARRMGISTVTEPQKYGLTLSVGTAETKLYEMTNAYAAFANTGDQQETVLVASIHDKYGKRIFEHKQKRAKRVIGQGAAFVISSILSDNTARAPLYGSSLNIPGRQVAVKTGTTDENKDAWTIGYSPSLAIGVWVGNNENKPMRGLAGGSSAGMIWRDTMISLVDDTPDEKFEMPPDVHQMAVCRGTEQRAASAGSNTYNEYFIDGAEPKGECNAARPTQAQPEDRKKEEQEEKPAAPEEETDTPPVQTPDPTTPAPTDPTTPAQPTQPTDPGTGGEGGRGGSEPTDPGSGGTTPSPARGSTGP